MADEVGLMRLVPKEKKTRLWLSSGAGVLLVLACLAALTAASRFAYARLDLSRGRIYSVSPASRRILKGLPDPVLVNVYYSKELPPQFAASRTYLLDLLKEYGSGGMVRTRLHPLGEDPKEKEEAMKAGISPVRFDIVSREKFEQREGFLGLTFQYRDKKDVVAFLQDTGGLEYDLTSRIKTLAEDKRPVLAFVTSRGALGPEGLEPAVRERLGARYELQSLDLESVSVDTGVPAGIGAFVLLGPQSKLSDKTLFLLDQALLSGRSLLVAADVKRVDMRSFVAQDQDSGLAPWLRHHGLGLAPSLVMDAQSQPIQVSMQQGPFMMTNIVQYPPMVLSSDMASSHPVTKDLDAVVFPFAAPVEVSGASVQVLARSSRYSWAKGGGFVSLNPFQLPPPADADPKGPFVLAAAAAREFEPFWKEPPASLKPKPKAPLAKAAKPGRLAVVGTSKFAGRDFRPPEGNHHFLLNLLDWLAQDEDLIAIRSKGSAFHPLREVPAGTKAAIRWSVIFAPALFVVLAGLGRWQQLRRRRAQAREEYGPQNPPSAPGADDAPGTTGKEHGLPVVAV